MNRLSVLNPAFSVFAAAQTDGDRTALVVDGNVVSYRSLAAKASQVAAWLRTAATPGEDPLRVGVLAGRTLAAYVGILATHWAGGTYVPLNPKHPGQRLLSVVERANLDALIADERGAAHLPCLLDQHRFPVIADCEGPGTRVTSWRSLPDSDQTGEPQAVSAQDQAYDIFTSGTTGLPKGVMVTYGNLAHFLACLRSLIPLRGEDRAAQSFDITFDASVGVMFSTWDVGASLYVVPETKVMAPGGFLREHRITSWWAVPSTLMTMQKLGQLQQGAYDSLRCVCVGGEPLSLELARAVSMAAPRSAIINSYGPTEATVACLQQELSEPPAETPGRGTLAIGRPFPGMTAEVVSESGDFLPCDTVGELALCGPQVAIGYLADPDLTGARFVSLRHPRLGPSRWYLTGDLAMRDVRGVFHCLGRVDNQVKVMGHRIELEEIEFHLRQIIGTSAVAAVTFPIAAAASAGLAAFVVAPPLAIDGIRQRLRSSLPPYMVPSRIIEIHALPVTPNGKIDRAALRLLLQEGLPS